MFVISRTFLLYVQDDIVALSITAAIAYRDASSTVSIPAFRMHIVAIAWIYVAFMMAITETSVVAAIMTFLFYGLLPVSILVYLTGGARRRQKRRMQALQQENSDAARQEVQRESHSQKEIDR